MTSDEKYLADHFWSQRYH